MAQPSTQDIIAPFDPTGYVSVSGADLLTLIQGAYPNVDQGFCLTTDDVAGIPQVPDAATNTKWQRYVWIRQSATTVSAYAWAENAVSDVTYLKWVSLTIAGIGVGSITGAMIADNTITDIKIVSLDYSKLTGAVPTGLPPSGVAGGDLTGTYPNPTVTWANITALTITTAMIDTAAVTGLKIANNTIDPSTKLSGNNAVANQLRVNGAGTGMEFFTPQVITGLTNPSISDAGKIVQVNGAGTGYQNVTSAILGNVLQTVTTVDYLYTSAAGTFPYDDTIPQTTDGGTEIATLATTITPLSTTSKLLVTVTLNADLSNNKSIVALFKDAGAGAVSASVVAEAGVDGCQPMILRYLLGATGALTAQTYHVYVGSVGAGTIEINGEAGSRKLGGVQGSSVSIVEYA